MDYTERGNISAKTLDLNRARQSLVEEFQAIMWYDERADATSDKELKEVLAHNRDDEKEHATLLLEWIRRNDKALAKKLEEIIFKNGKLEKLWD
jgi:uncharacterized protein